MVQITEGTRTQVIGTLSFNDITVDKWELMGLLEELEETDCFTSSITIYDMSLEKKLLEMEVIRRNIRGSCCPGKNYKDFYKQIYLICYEEEPK